MKKKLNLVKLSENELKDVKAGSEPVDCGYTKCYYFNTKTLTCGFDGTPCSTGGLPGCGAPTN